MLLLGGKKGDKFTIGSNVIVEIIEINGSQIRLGFHAPKEIAINRLVVTERIEAGVSHKNDKNIAIKPIAAGGALIRDRMKLRDTDGDTDGNR